jgi:hypothetical protein
MNTYLHIDWLQHQRILPCNRKTMTLCYVSWKCLGHMISMLRLYLCKLCSLCCILVLKGNSTLTIHVYAIIKIANYTNTLVCDYFPQRNAAGAYVDRWTARTLWVTCLDENVLYLGIQVYHLRNSLVHRDNSSPNHQACFWFYHSSDNSHSNHMSCMMNDILKIVINIILLQMVPSEYSPYLQSWR